ncbi:hypothetical protein HK405_004645, partial [Cladochytrium tenue]
MADTTVTASGQLVAPPPPYGAADSSAANPAPAAATTAVWDVPSFLLARYAQLAASINALETANHAVDEQRSTIDRIQTHLHTLAAREQELSHAVDLMAWRSKHHLNLPLLAAKVTGKPHKDPVAEAHLDHFRSDHDLADVRSEFAAADRDLDAARARLPVLIATTDPSRLAELHADRERLLDFAFLPPVPIPGHDQAFFEVQALTQTLSK